jgi:ATP-dependent Lon protease
MAKKAEKPDVFPLVPLRDIVVFPSMVVPLFVGRDRSVAAIEAAMLRDKLIMLVTQKDAQVNDPAEDDIYDMGNIAEILQVLKLADGTVKVLVEGKIRAKLTRYLSTDEFFEVAVAEVTEDSTFSAEIEALMRGVVELFENYIKLNQRMPPETLMSVKNIEDAGRLADTVTAQIPLKLTDKQELLETLSAKARLERLYQMLDNEIEILKIEHRVRGRVKHQMERSQKEYYLTEQMKAIQKELGREHDTATEVEELRQAIERAKMPKEPHERAMKELRRLEMMQPMSAESTVVRTYLEWLIELPWSKRTRDKLDMAEAERILDEDHYGLKKPKERIIEYLAVRKLVKTKSMKGPILCFVGPPGVGKTSLGRSIARATGRKFVRLSLGGVRDEAEIRGHRRTYIGALPGRIIQSLRRAGSKNPVFLLDEVDKMSMDFRGDPSAALMEVLDPVQNSQFNDHYLELDFDLSEVMFITTANVLYSIPQPLQDRMEIIRLPGYTEEEKVQIAKRFLVPNQIKDHGLTERNLKVPGGTLKAIIRQYTREAGVRNLEREIATLCRKTAKRVAKEGKKACLRLTARSLSSHLGIPRFRHRVKEEANEVGIAVGLAWTEFGGEILLTEATLMRGKGKLTLTGKLGDVMRESAQAALSYVRARTAALGVERNFYRTKDIHIHVPEGAIPKDGPSAGVTMVTALVSALTKRPVKRDVAMTGEITLRGKVLAVGGVKEKLLSAHRAGIAEVILPKECEKELQELPAQVKKALTIHFVEQVDDVLPLALEPARAKPTRRRTPPQKQPKAEQKAPEATREITTH